MNKPTKIITHHALSNKHSTVADVDSWHKDRWPGFISVLGYHVGYHYVIEWDGTTTQTRRHHEEGAHTIGQNTSSIGVCFMGNFDNHYPSEAQIAAWKSLYARFDPMPVFPHRKYASYKSCHGKLLNDEYFAGHVKSQQREKLIEQLKTLMARLQVLINRRNNGQR